MQFGSSQGKWKYTNNLGSVSTLTKMNNYFFSKNQFFLKMWNSWIFRDLIIYDIVTWVTEIIQSVAMIIRMIFNSTSHKKIISLFWGLFNDETDLRVRFKNTSGQVWVSHRGQFSRDFLAFFSKAMHACMPSSPPKFT